MNNIGKIVQNTRRQILLKLYVKSLRICHLNCSMKMSPYLLELLIELNYNYPVAI